MRPMGQRLHHPIEIPADILKLKDAFVAEAHKLYVVGGAVRDALLGKTPKDYDLATDAIPDEVERIAQAAGFKTLPTGKAFGVINVFTNDGEFEVATFREDIGSGRRPDAVRFTTIENDVQRRDLTINALFYDIDTEEVVDLVGGIEDLRNGVVRTVGDPRDRFGEDRLRILRAIRFAGRFGSELDPDVDQALREDASLEGISAERIRDEFLKGIASAKSVPAFLHMVDQYGLFAWVFRGLKVDIDAFKDAPRDHIVLLAHLLRPNDQKLLAGRLNALKYPDQEVRGVVFLVRLRGLSVESAVVLKKAQETSRVTPEQIRESGKLEGVERRMLDAFLSFDLSLTGPMIMEQFGLKPGKELGEKLSQLETDNFRSLLGGVHAAVVLEVVAARIEQSI